MDGAKTEAHTGTGYAVHVHVCYGHSSPLRKLRHLLHSGLALQDNDHLAIYSPVISILPVPLVLEISVCTLPFTRMRILS